MSKKKDQILDIALTLFLEKGFDKTSISDILERTGIARGTLYYHFESKEAIMDAIIDRAGESIMSKIESIVEDHAKSAYEKLFSLFFAMNMSNFSGGRQMLDYLNQPQNALFHEKSNRMIVERTSPMLGRVIRQGVEEGIWQTDFPDEAAEIMLIIVSDYLDSRYLSAGGEEFQARFAAFLYHAEKMLGAQPGSFARFMDRIAKGKGDEDNEPQV